MSMELVELFKLLGLTEVRGFTKLPVLRELKVQVKPVELKKLLRLMELVELMRQMVTTELHFHVDLEETLYLDQLKIKGNQPSAPKAINCTFNCGSFYISSVKSFSKFFNANSSGWM